MKQQQRFIIALVASAAVLIIWNVLFPVKQTPPDPNANANANVQQAASPAPSPTAQAAATGTPVTQAQATSSPAPTPEMMPQRKLRIVTPYYEATFDTHGAVATSWILKKNKNNQRDIQAAGSSKANPKPVELVPAVPPGLSPDLVIHPFQILTGDASIDTLLATRNYRTFGPNAETGDETINVPSGSKQIDFVIHDDATGLDATKRVTFFADSYIANVEVKLTRGNQPVPEAKLAVGSSIGDQSIDHYSFYLYPPEGLAMLNGAVQRINPLEVHAEKRNGGFLA